MIFRYRKYFNIDKNSPETGIILDLEDDKFNQLLSSGYIYLKNEEEIFQSNLTAVFPEELDFPDDLNNEIEVKNFISNIYICTYESNSKKLALLQNESIFNYLPKIKDNVKSIPLLSEVITQSEHFDKRLPNELSGIKDNYLGRTNSGCGYSSDGLTCYDIDCYADYAWIENKICYLYFGGDLSGINFIDLFPFSLG